MNVKSLPAPRSAFGRALRQVRKAKKISQEDFYDTSGRTYISALERGVKQPTLAKVEGLSEVLQVHPLTLLTLSYTDANDQMKLEHLVNTILLEARDISEGLAREVNEPLYRPRFISGFRP